MVKTARSAYPFTFDPEGFFLKSDSSRTIRDNPGRRKKGGLSIYGII